MYQPILDHIAGYVSLSPQEQELCCSLFTQRKFKKYQFLLQEGNICQYDYFVITGCLRQYEVNDDGREYVVQFAFENWWIADWQSMLHNKPSIFNIDALESSEVLMIEKNDLDRLFREIPAMDTYFRKMMTSAFLSLQRRLLFQQKTAEERYADFFNTYGHFEQRISQQHIASYLGITRETLSRIKSQHVRQLKP
ncbi:Crp/Fnr family transcriptional regulator [Chitinophaga solisilvae]|uniref:Crp/Fnr family transcriptional regulator n=1 Tax=Chitinophaga solisilvae TaxID=1233460 RepID=A0A9Q5D530_9BACT|nr:Crp/Fnr family transcriptional regulator [Chitinophaga solisilvae]NSL86410.1 Crp/Fnr family transcriptional regulator [Chitinophaga solisilvae]